MCFYDDDYDWIAEIQIVTDGENERRERCNECRRWIEVGDQCRRVFQQENETCSACDGEDPACEHEHDYGETYNYVCCRECITILDAIKRVEQAEGCPAYAQQPNLNELGEALWEHESRWKYAEAALAADEGLYDHPLISLLLEDQE